MTPPVPDAMASLLLFAIVATGSPGGATTLATASGALFGFRRSLPLLTGIAAGIASLSAAAAAGLAALLLAFPAAELVLKLAGSGYLLWLAGRIARSGSPRSGPGGARVPTGFWIGVLLLLTNPKGWTVALAGAAAFAAPSAEPFRAALLLSGTLGTAAVASLSLWCAGGVLLARRLRTERQWRVVNAALGALLAISILPLWLT